MTEELEVRYLVESVEGTFCVYGYDAHGGTLSLTEGDGVVHNISLDNIIKVTKESVTKKDITSSIKELALV